MKKQIYILGILFMNIVFLSCETVVSDYSNLPQPVEKLVVHSFISPQDTVLYVKVTASSPVFGVYKGGGFGFSVNGKDTVFFKGDAIENAKVLLSSGTNSVSLSYLKKEAVYAIDAKKFKIDAGKTYNLRVEANGKVAESSCTIPLDIIKIKKYSIDSTRNPTEFGRPAYKSLNVNFEWEDLKGKTNLYFVKANIYADFLIPTSTDGKQVNYKKQKQFYQAFWNTEDFQNDTSVDGTTFTVRGAIDLRTPTLNLSGKLYESRLVIGKIPVRMDLLNIDENYYKYHLAIRRNRAEDQNPFVEPTPMYSNMKGGLGCFGASNEYSVLVDF